MLSEEKSIEPEEGKGDLVYCVESVINYLTVLCYIMSFTYFGGRKVNFCRSILRDFEL